MEYKLCEQCHAKPAVTYCTKIFADGVVNVAVCRDCSTRLKNLDGYKLAYSDGFFMPAYDTENVVRENKGCSVCGMSLQRFIDTGYLGCPECYRTCAPYLTPVVKRIQGSTRHAGKVPKVLHAGGGGTRRRLEQELERAVAEQRFEDAAKLRDKLNRL